jgi:hypothetical protein
LPSMRAWQRPRWITTCSSTGEGEYSSSDKACCM